MICKLKACLNLLGRVRWFVTWWVENGIIGSDSTLAQNIIRYKIKSGKKKGWIKIEFWHISVLIAHLQHDLYFETNHSLLLLKKWLNKKNYYKHRNVKRTRLCSILLKDIQKIKSFSLSNTRGVEGHRNLIRRNCQKISSRMRKTSKMKVTS